MSVRNPVVRRTRLGMESLEARDVPAGFLTATPSYLVPSAPAVDTVPILTVGDAVGGYKFAGIPDGAGAYDNRDGTFTVLVNHELIPTVGKVNAHGARGAFVSKWVLNKSDLSVVSGGDLIQSVQLWNPATGSYDAPSAVALARLCSADLAEPGAFFNAATGRGTRERIFLNGEEFTEGRGFATIVSGPNAGKTFELPWMGKMAFENIVASPFAQDKTLVAVLDDSSRGFSTEGVADPSEVYFYLGAKRNSGTELERAGLIGGLLHGVRVLDAAGAAVANELGVVNGARFQLASLGDVSTKGEVQLQADSIASTVTQFRRVEDGAWDPRKPNDFYFVTTDRFGGATKLWRLRFDDVRRPELGGTITAVVDSPAGVPGEMFDNMAMNRNGQALLQEDPGNQAYLAKIWQYDTASNDLTEVAAFDPAVFSPTLPDGSPNPNFLTRDEESSGIIDLSGILGRGYYLSTVQAHAAFTADPELVEHGQLVILNTNDTSATLSNGVLRVQGGVGNDEITVSRTGRRFNVTVNGRSESFPANRVTRLRIDGGAGADAITVRPGVFVGSIITGGQGNDVIQDGNSPSVLIGGTGADRINAGAGSDLLIAGATSIDNDESKLSALYRAWTSGSEYADRVQDVRDLFTDLAVTVTDADDDELRGRGGLDFFWMAETDQADAQEFEYVN